MEKMFELDVQVTASNTSPKETALQEHTTSCFCTIASCW
jgi:hypothetical protein